MKHTKKLLCMVISMLMLLTVCVPAMAENDSNTTEVYVVAGESYLLNGEEIDTSVPGRKVLDDSTVLNIGMYEPIAVENFEDKTAGDTVGVEAKYAWSSYGGAKAGAVYTAEENAIVSNQYLAVSEVSYLDKETQRKSSSYGPTYSLTDYKAETYEEGLTGKIAFDFKLRIPEDGIPNLENKEDNERARIRLITSSLESNKSVYNSPWPYIEADIYVDNGSYYYRTVEKDENSSSRFYNKLPIAAYDAQWISLRMVVDTATNTYDLYSGNEKLGPGGYASYYKNLEDKTDDQAVCDIAGLQFTAYGNTVLHLDDVVISQFDTTKTPVYYTMDAEQTYSIEAGTEVAELKVPATFKTEDGTAAMDGKTVGFTLYSQPESTDMVGKFYYDINNYQGAYITYDIYKKAYTLNQKFDEYTPNEAWTGITVENENGNNVLKANKPGLDKMRFEGPVVTDSIYEAGYKIKFDLWSDTEQGNNLMVQLMDGGTTVLNMKHVASKSTGKYNLQVGSTEYITRNTMVSDGTTWNDIRFKINETENIAEVYLNGTFVTTMPLVNTTVDPKQWRIYDYESNNTDNNSSVYIDDLWIATYAGVASVDNSDLAITVVKGQEAKAYATTTLTDGTTNKLPITWDAPVDTSVCGEVTATGTVDGYLDGNGNAVTVNATITVIPYPYTISVEGTALTATKLTDYAPEATVYGAVYDATGKLVSVEILATLGADTVWTAGVATVTLAEEKDYYVFTWNDGIQPLAAAAQ